MVRSAKLRSAEAMVFTRNIVTVMGPTPPGTGVMCDLLTHTLELDVADQLSGKQAVDAHVDDDSSGAYHLRKDEVELVSCYDENVGQEGELCEIACLGVADAYRGVSLHEH